MIKIKTLAVLLLFAPLAFSCSSKSNMLAESHHLFSNGEKESKIRDEVVTEDKWELPSILKEVSGIAFLDSERFACVQDESGTIFIYNTTTAEIEKKVSFAGDGDFEGLTLAGENAYIVRSDGRIYSAENWRSGSPKIAEYYTPLTEDHNVEGIAYDKAHNRLLLAIKGSEPGNKDYKGIYAFDLSAKKLEIEPVYKIDLTHSVFDGTEKKDKQKTFQPSEISIHPLSGEIYITDAKNPKIIILNQEGEIRSLYHMNKIDFPQAEGIAFSPSGELFISSEGKKGSGTISKISIKNQ